MYQTLLLASLMYQIFLLGSLMYQTFLLVSLMYRTFLLATYRDCRFLHIDLLTELFTLLPEVYDFFVIKQVEVMFT